ncbi:MAG: cobalt ECF transporter T component CbiQ [Motiliproteus sp.]|nr:cobalt ECF transporter T component CbiQ [Motiliproteus sp.]MCW9051450.1 cobalt ECF transporter T component CbiQ [Motiliproteus sp.]
MNRLFQLSQQPPQWLSQSDPRLRVILALLLALVTVNLSGLAILGFLLISALSLALSAGIPFSHLLKRLLAFEGFMLLVLLFVPFSIAGDSILQLGPFAASEQGLERAITIVLRANTVVIGLLALLGTMEPEVLGHSLAKLKLPEKLVHLFLLTIRYIGVLYDEYQRLRQAMRARAFVAGSNRHSWRSFGWLIGMLLVRSLQRSQRILGAMKCRGFHGQFYLLDNQRWQNRDSIFLTVAVTLLAIPLTLDTLL